VSMIRFAMMNPMRRAMPFWIAVFLVFVSLCRAVPAAESIDADAQFGEAKEAFEKGDYRKVVALCNSIITDGKKLSPALFQLLGNTRYRQGDLGRAVLWYRRAALFPPPNAETRQNLSHLHDRTGNLSFPGNSLGDQVVAYLTRTQWLAIAVFCGWAFVILVVLAFLLVRRGDLRVFLITVAVLMLIFSVASWAGWSNRPSYEKIKDLAFVTGTGVSAYTAASVTSSGTVIQLPPGSEVRKLNDSGAWCYVEIPKSHPDGDKLRGWVQKDALSDFWPDPATHPGWDTGYLE